MRVQILTDEKSWVWDYVIKLEKALPTTIVSFHTSVKDIREGDYCFMLGWYKLLTKEDLSKNVHNIVIHAADLPQGRGHSPVSWQVIEGKNKIPLVMIEAVESPDAGLILRKSEIELEGHELIDEIRSKVFNEITRLIVAELTNPSKGEAQKGEVSYYRKRTPEDLKIDTSFPLISQFNLLRIADNKRYPAFFYHNGHKYVLTIKKEYGKWNVGRMIL